MCYLFSQQWVSFLLCGQVCLVMKKRTGSDGNLVLWKLFKCSSIVKSKGQHCKHLHKWSEFQSSYSALYYMASEHVGMWSGLCLLEISGCFSYKSLILKHQLTAHKVLSITSFQLKDFCPNMPSWSIWGQISTTAQWNEFPYQFHS